MVLSQVPLAPGRWPKGCVEKASKAAFDLSKEEQNKPSAVPSMAREEGTMAHVSHVDRPRVDKPSYSGHLLPMSGT